MTAFPYQYLVLRLVPRVEREEFINVGVVLFAQDVNYLDGSFHLSAPRALALDPHIDLAAVASALDTVCEVARGQGGAPGLLSPGRRFGWLAAPRSTVIQPSPVHGGISEDPAATLHRLLEQLVLVSR